MIRIGRIFRFEAAHFLPNHLGKCKDVHGHSYKLEVIVKGHITNQVQSSTYGMLMDFGKLKVIVEGFILERLDHKLLNYIMPNPTAENLVVWIVKELHHWDTTLEGVEITLDKVRLWETEDSWVEWRAI